MLKKVKISREFLERNGFELVTDISKKTQETHMFRSSDEKYAKIIPNGNIIFLDDETIIPFEKAKRGKIKV